MATWPNVDNTNLSTQNDEYILYQNGINYVQNLGTLSGAVDQGEWVSTFDYEVNDVVRGSDKKRYIAIQESGPNKGGAQDPISTPSHWFDCTEIFKSRQATQQEALDGTDVDAYMPPDLVHAAFNQYGVGDFAVNLNSNDDLLNLHKECKFVRWGIGDSPTNAPFTNDGVGVVIGSGGNGYILLDRVTGHKWTYTQSGTGDSGWRRDLTLDDKATTSEAQSGVDGKFPDAAGVHAAFNQYGVGDFAVNLNSNDDLLNLHKECKFVRWGIGDSPTNAPFTNDGVGVVIGSGGNGYILLDRVTGHKWTYTQSGTGDSGWRRDLTLDDKATASEAQAGNNNDKFITPNTLSQAALGSRKYQMVDKSSINQVDVWYTNTTGSPKFVSASTESAFSGGMEIKIKDLSGTEYIFSHTAQVTGPDGSLYCIVPDGWSYKITRVTNVDIWMELTL